MLHACAKRTRAASSEEPIRTQDSHATYHSTHRKQQEGYGINQTRCRTEAFQWGGNIIMAARKVVTSKRIWITNLRAKAK